LPPRVNICVAVSPIEPNMPQTGVWRPSPINRYSTERRPIEFDEVRVATE
jgi:hypothetical protein